MSKINVIGASCIDILVSKIDKDQFFSNKYKVDTIKMSYGGDALNEVSVLSHFKADCRLISILGNDKSGLDIINHLNENNIKYNSNILRDDIETSTSLVLIEENGERSFVGNKNGSVRKLKYEDIIIDEDCEIVSFASLFISQELNNEELLKLFKEIKDRNITLCVDCSSPKNNEKIEDLSCLKYADYFFLNKYEASLLCNSDDIEEIYQKFKDNNINAIIKCGKDGAYYQDKYYQTNIINNPIDTTGAGDSFLAGFILGLNDKMDIDDCIKQANEFGGKACEYIGATNWINHIKI